jgi:aspartyl-tRNA(Asn)/glutamyl-tRNA(Gln) amidotransferase subunit A
MELITLSLTSLRDKLASREVSASEATKACLARIDATEPKLGALIHLDAEQALRTAAALDAAGPDPSKPLWGVPLTIKDVITVTGAPTTCGSRILKGFTPFYDATLVARLKDAGAVLLGKANMDEFAMGSTTESSAFGPTRNPWDLERTPGGSSGGSAASVAAGQCFGSIGTDTGGSIRQPASFCGVVGLKPTYGRVSRYGLIAYGSSLDQAGPLTRTVEDAALMLQVIAGHDEKDSTSADVPAPDYLAALKGKDLKGLRLGLPREFWGQGLDPEVERCLREATQQAKDLGAELVDVSLPHTQYAIATYYIVAMAEASSNLARFDGVRFGHRDKSAAELLDMYVQSRSQGFGDEVQRRILIGTYVLSAGYYDAYYRKAAQVRRLIRQDFLDAFQQCDVICGAASPVPAWKLGALSADPLQMYLMDIFTISLNLAGLPGLCLPVGKTRTDKLPVGLQLFGKAFDEAALLKTGYALQQSLPALGAPTL